MRLLGNKYLSEAIEQDCFRIGCLNLIYAPVGCGKTYWALNCLAASMENKYKILYLIDTTNGRDKLLKNPDTMFYNKSWRDNALNDRSSFGETKVVVMTYAKFGVIASEFPQFGDTFKYIICDELHNLPRFSAFKSNDNSDASPVHILAWNRLTDIINNTKVIVIGLSATPERLVHSERFTINSIPVDKDIRRYEIESTKYYSNIDVLLKALPIEGNYLMYVVRITEMKRIWEIAKDIGFRAIAIWSKNNEEHPMTVEQLEARDYIIREEKIPEKYNLAIINASSETAINLRGKSPIFVMRGKIDAIIINCRDNETIVQARGRYRNDLKTLYLLDNSTITDVPPTFLNTKLYQEDKTYLCETIKLRNEQGRIL